MVVCLSSQGFTLQKEFVDKESLFGRKLCQHELRAFIKVFILYQHFGYINKAVEFLLLQLCVDISHCMVSL